MKKFLMIFMLGMFLVSCEHETPTPNTPDPSGPTYVGHEYKLVAIPDDSTDAVCDFVLTYTDIEGIQRNEEVRESYANGDDLIFAADSIDTNFQVAIGGAVGILNPSNPGLISKPGFYKLYFDGEPVQGGQAYLTIGGFFIIKHN